MGILMPHPITARCPNFYRPAEEFGDVTLSVQAGWGYYCKLADQFIPLDHKDAWNRGRLGCAHVPLEFYESCEIALWWTDVEVEKVMPAVTFGTRFIPEHRYTINKWITKPSIELGIDDFDDLWQGDDVAGWVPLARAGALQVALRLRANVLVHHG